MDIRECWERCREFHGHTCKGLLIGFMASLYAIRLLGLKEHDDEDVVCISECDSCSVDAIQVMLGCTVGRGSLLFHMTGKSAFSFYQRSTGRSVRLVLSGKVADIGDMDIEEYLTINDPESLFSVKETAIPLPERARFFDSYVCEGCGEVTGANWIHIQDGHKLCPDCYVRYDRFNV